MDIHRSVWSSDYIHFDIIHILKVISYELQKIRKKIPLKIQLLNIIL